MNEIETETETECKIRYRKCLEATCWRIRKLFGRVILDRFGVNVTKL